MNQNPQSAKKANRERQTKINLSANILQFNKSNQKYSVVGYNFSSGRKEITPGRISSVLNVYYRLYI